jgi:cytochrome c peroxidase
VRRHTSAFVAAGFAAVFGILSLLHTGPAAADQPFPPYNPYPPGILPSDLDAEIARVQREVQFIFNEALNESKALPRPTPAGNPPVLRGSGNEAVEILGKLMNFDLNISPFRNEACASCHLPYAAFGGLIPSVNPTMVAYPGTLHYRVGKRTAQRYTYSPDFPVLKYNVAQSGFYAATSGMRARPGIGCTILQPRQARDPPLDTQEMANPDFACVTADRGGLVAWAGNSVGTVG